MMKVRSPPRSDDVGSDAGDATEAAKAAAKRQRKEQNRKEPLLAADRKGKAQQGFSEDQRKENDGERNEKNRRRKEAKRRRALGLPAPAPTLVGFNNEAHRAKHAENMQ